jgi:glyoxylase I family protein
MKVDQETQDAIKERLEAAGYFESGQAYPLNHGYCWSLYCFDPAGLLIEFTVDHEDVEQINATRAALAHEELAKWLGGDHTPNNTQFHR